MSPRAPTLPVSLPIDLTAFLAGLEASLEEARRSGHPDVAQLDVPALLARLRAEYVRAALEQADGDLTMAAALLGVPAPELTRDGPSIAAC